MVQRFSVAKDCFIFLGVRRAVASRFTQHEPVLLLRQQCELHLLPESVEYKPPIIICTSCIYYVVSYQFTRETRWWSTATLDFAEIVCHYKKRASAKLPLACHEPMQSLGQVWRENVIAAKPRVSLCNVLLLKLFSSFCQHQAYTEV